MVNINRKNINSASLSTLSEGAMFTINGDDYDDVYMLLSPIIRYRDVDYVYVQLCTGEVNVLNYEQYQNTRVTPLKHGEQIILTQD